ncbi:MAG: hypothetical protein Q9227_003613 [Pyrenula ochraceoflavens]
MDKGEPSTRRGATSNPNSESEQQGKGLSGRVVSSATDLLSNAVRGSRNEAIAILSNSVANDAKGLPSSSTSSEKFFSEPSYKHQDTHAGPSSLTDDAGSQGLRSSKTRIYDIDSFERSGHDSDILFPQSTRLDHHDERGNDEEILNVTDKKGKGVANQRISDIETPSWQEMTAVAGSWASQYQQANSTLSQDADLQADGNDVVRLLSDPSFQPSIWPDDASANESTYTISAEDHELAMLFQNRFEKSENDQQSQREASHGRKESTPTASKIHPISERLESSLAKATDQHAIQELDSFFAQLHMYVEEVWGYSQPLIEQAREEVKQTTPGLRPDGPALSRLRQLLGHVEA